ncbi:Grx4 family monothiol glutaredoxin [Pseudomonas sp. 910_23]|jgi:monothiol glutaredoxin|uniref:Grx4 family monothiol glutaredoxin n=1 Tax=unclassified Pseudomonas TaxID=196821 RepID=UPI000CDB74EF|nr:MULTISPECIES: Grx4 family monothiol glutaredoxin [unclassified Pseudomonas]MCK3828881.1 Grx4 family monothiol glutaredoxin [Pseudomonas sp. W2Aug9]
MNIHTRIDDIVQSHNIVLFMKGSAQYPMDGFSAKAIQMLETCLDPTKIHTVDVLEDDELRQGIKDYSNYPTIPQLYVKGEFIGGRDIIIDMHASGELQQLLNASE